MSEINRSRQQYEPYEPGVYMVTGVNGIGKSTIVDAIANDHPETVPLHASQELSQLFNGITREQMELLAPEEKLGRMVTHFTARFEQILESERAVILDTHLLVPIRKNGKLIYEDIWSDEYSPYISSMAMLSADPEVVKAWRLEDEVKTGRKRSTNPSDITLDQDANLARFGQLKTSGIVPAHSGVVENIADRLSDTRAAIETIFRNI